MTLALRKIKEFDKDLLFKWRNYPEIVERSTSQKEVAYSEHSSWFDRMYQDISILPFIIEVNGEPCGHARLEKDDRYSVITIYLLNSNIGKGYGVKAISLACQQALQHWPDSTIVAFVRSENLHAQAAFKKACFQVATVKAPINHVAMMLNREKHEELYTANHYSDRMDIHGDAYESLNWGSQQGQELRFKILSEIANLNGMRILDVGCGLGDFAGWLKNNNINVDYTGIDITEKFIDVAKEKYPEHQFFSQSISDTPKFKNKTFDYVFASGIFATYAVNGQEWLQQCVEMMWRLADKGVAFNSLSSWAEDKDDNEYYAEPEKICRLIKHITPWFVFRHDYHPRDMTFYMMRSKQS